MWKGAVHGRTSSRGRTWEERDKLKDTFEQVSLQLKLRVTTRENEWENKEN